MLNVHHLEAMRTQMTVGPSQLPTYDGLMNAVLRAIRDLGGSGTIEEINERVYEIAGLSDETLAVPHGDVGGVRYPADQPRPDEG